MEGSLGPRRRHIILLTPPEAWRYRRCTWAGGEGMGQGALGGGVWEREEELGLSWTRWVYHTEFRPGRHSCRLYMLRKARQVASPLGCQIAGNWSQRRPQLPGGCLDRGTAPRKSLPEGRESREGRSAGL